MNRLVCLRSRLCACAASAVLRPAAASKVSAPRREGDTGPRPAATWSRTWTPTTSRWTIPSSFPLATAGEYVAAPELNVTGVVSPDVSRQVPVPSLASGAIVEIDARLGDEVKKGQLLFKVRSTDIAGAFSDYRKAVKNEELAKIQLDRAKLLFEHGAIPKSDARNRAERRGQRQGRSRDHHRASAPAGLRPRPSHRHRGGVTRRFRASSPTSRSPIASGVQALTPPNPFTISDLSHVWIVCDVYENDLAQVHLANTPTSI